MTAGDLGLVPARMSLAATMLKHGLPKLRGEGRAQAAGFMEQLGFKPGARFAVLVGAAEVFAGVSLALGVATRVGALAVLATQGVAVAKVHAPKGFDNMAGGWEFNALLMATALGVLLAGPGEVSVHGLLRRGVESGPRRLERGARWLLDGSRRLGARRFGAPRPGLAASVTRLLA
ncbi:MAG TPA: DoxX family protein [Anaeromyxobacter sp.]